MFEDRLCKRCDTASNLTFRFEVKSNSEEQRANSQPTPTHAGGDHKFSAAPAFGAPIENFGGGGGASEIPAAAARPARCRALDATVELSHIGVGGVNTVFN